MNLSKVFQVILQKNIKNLTVVDVCGLISKKGLSTSKNDLKTLLKEYNINSIKDEVNNFKKEHPELKINYIYTGPGELNSKKKTHMLLYVFTEAV